MKEVFTSIFIPEKVIMTVVARDEEFIEKYKDRIELGEKNAY